MQVFNPAKAKEEAAELAKATTDSEDPEADLDAEAESVVDPHLDETIQITRDYSSLLNKNAKPAVVLKEAAAR